MRKLISIGRRVVFAGAMAAVVLSAPVAARAQARSDAAAMNRKESSGGEQAYRLPPEKLTQAIALNKIRVWLDIAGSLWGLVVIWGLLALGGAARLEVWAWEIAKNRWLQGALFFAVVVVILTLASLPLDALGHGASLRYGISVQGWPAWLGDQAKGLGVSLLIGVPVALFFNWVVRVSPQRYWVWLWVISIPLIVFGVFLAPMLLDPVFNKFEPLERTHESLTGKLEEVVARTGTAIAPERMFLMKASAKTNGINAYVTGIGASKRFVMWDTTTDRMPDDEIMFIFGHESGHYVLNHIPKMLGALVVGLFFVFWVCAYAAEGLVRRRGERCGIGGVASRSGFLTLFFAFSVAGFVMTPVVNGVSRHFEHEADVYGQEAIHGLVADPERPAVSSFNHLGEAWLDDPNPNAFVEFWSYSHPSVQERATFARQYDPWANGGVGRFFKR